MQCALLLVLVYVTAWISIRLRRPTRGELAICGKSSESSNAIAGDGPVVEPEPAPRRRERAPRQAMWRSSSQPALGSRLSPPRSDRVGEAAALKVATVGLGRAAAEAAVGSRGKLGLRLAGAGAVGPWRRGNEGVYEFDVPGAAGVYTVRMPLVGPGVRRARVLLMSEMASRVSTSSPLCSPRRAWTCAPCPRQRTFQEGPLLSPRGGRGW